MLSIEQNFLSPYIDINIYINIYYISLYTQTKNIYITECTTKLLSSTLLSLVSTVSESDRENKALHYFVCGRKVLKQ